MKAVDRPRTEIAADLRFSVELPGHQPVSGTMTGVANRLEVRLSDPAYFAGGRDAAHLRQFASGLAERGITVIVISGDVVLLEVGLTRPPWWQRPLTRSPYLKVASLRGAVTGAIGRVRHSAAEAVLPGSELLPPTTMFPLAPTFGPSERRVTTTHDPRRGGNPRLVLSTGNMRMPADQRVLFPLRGDSTMIGSAPECDIGLEDLAAVQAEVVHDDNDELVLFDRLRDGSTLLNGARVPAEGRVLRTGSRISMGPWTLIYRRAEYADHGRPFGGRVGGEFGHQRSQPDPRPGSPRHAAQPRNRTTGTARNEP